MSITKLEVARGVTLNVMETDKFKTNYLSVNFLVPLREETASLNSLIPRVLSRGSEKYPTLELFNKRLDYLYSASFSESVMRRGENQMIEFAAQFVDNVYAFDDTDITGGVIEMLDQLIFHPLTKEGRFVSEYVESEKRNLIDSIKAQINNKRYYAIARCGEEMCRGENYRFSAEGTVEGVSAITPESLWAQYKHLLKNSRVEIFFSGRCDPEKLRGIFAYMFAGGMDSIPELKTEVIRTAGEVREVIEDQPVAQGKLSVGFRTGHVLSDGNYHIFALFNELYGGSPTSKLFTNVRERLSLCYYCSSRPEALKGVMIVASGIEVDKFEQTRDEIIAQLEGIKAGNFTDGELESAKNALINGYRAHNDSPAALDGWYLSRMLAGLSDSPDDAAAKVAGVTREQIIEAAGKVVLDTVYFLRGTLLPEGEDDAEGTEE
ncbi:MAG: insulinase family protein [Clostridiales bacterium]|nr:insulinase family protein [Clostridiales bacterium]